MQDCKGKMGVVYTISIFGGDFLHFWYALTNLPKVYIEKPQFLLD